MKAFFAILFLLQQALCANPAPLMERTEVFPPGLDDVKLFRIPGLVVTPRGTVLAYCEARRNSASDWGEIEIHMRRSMDGGKTWEAGRKIAHEGSRIEGNPHKKETGATEQTVNNPVAIVDRETGAIEFLYCINYARCFSMRSTDDGLTWTAPKEITSIFEPFRAKVDWKVIATGPGHGIQTKSGRLVVPVWLAFGKEGAHAPSASGTIYSDDHGATWKAGEIAVPNEGEFGNPNETVAAELSDGRIMLVSRNVSAPNRKLVTTSPDGASRWSKPIFHHDLWEPICMAGLTSHPSPPSTLLFSGAHTLERNADGSEKPAGRGKRQNLTIMLSRDDGKTWPVQKTMEPGNAAYSDLAVLKDGTVICLFEGPKGVIYSARFNLEWLHTTP